MNFRRRTAGILSVLLLSAWSAGCTGKTDERGSVDVKSMESVNVSDFGAAVDGSSHVGSAVASAAKKAGKAKCLYFPPGLYAVTEDLTISVPVRLAPNARFDVRKGVVLTFEGPVDAGLQKIFRGEGRVRCTDQNTFGYPQWFDDGTAGLQTYLQKALDSLRGVYLPAGTYNLTDLIVRSPVVLRGIGALKTEITALNGTRRLFDIQSGGVTLENLKIDMQNAGKNAVCFYFNNEKKGLKDLAVRNVDVVGGSHCIQDSGNAEHAVDNAVFESVSISETKDSAAVFRSFKKGLRLTDFSVLRRSLRGGRVDVPGVVIENAEDMTAEHFDVNGDIETKATEGHGVVLRNCKNVTMRRVLMEYLGGSGFVVRGGSGFDFENVQVYTFSGVGFDISGLKDSEFNVVKVTYTSGAAFSEPKENLLLAECENLTIRSLISNFSRGPSLAFKSCRDVRVDSVITHFRTGPAVADLGGNRNVTINGLRDNRSGSAVSLLDEGIVIYDFLPAEGEPVSKITGPMR